MVRWVVLVMLVILASSLSADSKLPDTRAKQVARLKDNIKARRGYDAIIEHHAPGPDGAAPYVRRQPENEQLCEALVAHGAIEAVPWIKRAHAYAVKLPVDHRDPSAISHYAACVYALSLETVDVWEGNAFKPYVAAPIEEEQARMRVRPDLEPTRGLVASLSITPPRHDNPTWLFASLPLGLSVTLTNVSTERVTLDVAATDLVFSYVTSGERHEVAAKDLPAPTIEWRGGPLAPNDTIRITWTVPKLATAPFAANLGTGGVFVKAIYKPTNLVSNTLSLYYFHME